MAFIDEIEIGQLAELTTQVATTGALGAAHASGDQMLQVTDQVFEFIIGIVVIVQGTCGS